MYLKKVIVQGFKSFADKLVFDLNDGITGIVGPNGSGKSNVVDAIKWVLGEQSVKSLRGEGNMTDVIFAGSKSRKALNVASVELIFDNTDHYLSLNFDEVSVRRRVYSDGTNEYFINNEQCRLKDISDLFMDSGIGRESFNIISQGKIDDIISTRPTDRRVIFEEAAGVLKYKKRKEEAIRKLEKTHDNMNRVEDIISELEVQVKPLKEQKENALLYNKLSDELQNVEIALIADDITNINYKYQSCKEKIEVLSKEILDASVVANSGEVKIVELKNKLESINEKIKLEQSNLVEMTALVEKLLGEKNIIVERKKYEVDDVKLHNNIVSLHEEALKIDVDINSLKNELELINSNYSSVLNDIKSKDEEINLIESKKRKSNLKLSSVIVEKNKLERKINDLKECIDNNSLLPLAVRQVLDNPKLSGIYDVIGNLFDVSEEYSLAISTVLGAGVNNIVVENELAAKEAISYLKSGNFGRATFFPLSVIKPKYVESSLVSDLKNISGFIDVASSLVCFDKKYHNIITNQLGNVLVVDNIDTANVVSKKVNYSYRIVTLSGELIHVGGSLTGGNSVKSRNIISDKYDLENSIKKFDVLTSDIKNIEEEINKYDYDITVLEDERHLLLKNKLELEEEVNSKNKSISDLSDKLENVQNEINGTNNILSNSLEKEEQEILDKYYEAINNKNKIINNLEILNKEKNEVNNSLNDYESNLRHENSSLSLKNKELKELEIDVNRMDVKLDNLLNNLSENYSMTYEKAVSFYKLEMSNDQARNRVSNLKREIKDLGPVNLGAIEEYDRVSERYEFLIDQKNDLVNAENILLNIISEMDEIMEREFFKTFNVVKEKFKETFVQLFKGGSADLKLTDPDNLLETGVEIVASPPGKTLKSISLLSGGEKTFTAISLLFAILKTRPVPFCILDEVEAALDEANVESFGDYLINLKTNTQFILITHKKKTMEYVDVLYGITMQESGISKLVSVRLEDLK